jgi:putative intracellular protease/amidase
LAKIYGADFDAVFFPGSHGAVWDLSENADSQRLIETFVAEGRPLAAGCHAPAILKHTKSADGIPLVSIRRVTEFNNPEEAGFGLTFAVPFVIEDMLKAHGGLYKKALIRGLM